MLTDVRTVVFELRFLPYLWARPNEKPHRPNDVSIIPYSELGKNLKLIDHWWASGWAAETSERMQAGIEASRYSGGSRRKGTFPGRMMLVCLASRRDDTSSERMEQWIDWRLDRMTRRPDGWQGIWNLLSFLQCRVFWKVESLFTASLNISDFVQKEWGQNTNKLPIWPFWDKNILTSFEINSRYKNKNYSPFVAKGLRVNQSNKKPTVIKNYSP